MSILLYPEPEEAIESYQALTVTVTLTPPGGDVTTSFIMVVNWTPPPAYTPPGSRVDIKFGDGATDFRDGVGPPITFTHKYAASGTYTIEATVENYYPSATGSRSLSVEVAELAVAPEYERTHFIGHALYNPGLTREQLLGQSEALETEIENDTGYKAFVVDIKIQQYPPTMTDIDFIIDVPTTKTLGPMDPLTLIAIIAIIAAIFAWIFYLFWTTWIQKVKLYYCDQCPEVPSFEGWETYVAHLSEKHPTKYAAVQEAESTNWWEQLPSTAKWIVGGVVVVSVVSLLSVLLKGVK